MRDKRSRILLVALGLVLVIAAAGFLGAGVFRVRDVQVVGAQMRAQDEILRLAGVEMGQSIFKIDTKRIKTALEEDPYLQVVEVTRKLPATLTLTVHEREVRAVVDWAGALLVLDETGQILDIRMQPGGIDAPFITGLQVRAYNIGSKVETEDQLQLGAMEAVLYELKRQQADDEISEINLKNTQGIYMVTRSGFVVRIGDTEALEKKIQILRGVLPILAEEGHTSGIINITSGKEAVFQPPQPTPDPNAEGTEGTPGTDGAEPQGQTAQPQDASPTGDAQDGTTGGAQDGTTGGAQDGTTGGAQDGTAGGTQDGTGGTQDGTAGGTQDGTGGTQDGTTGGAQGGTTGGTQNDGTPAGGQADPNATQAPANGTGGNPSGANPTATPASEPTAEGAALPETNANVNSPLSLYLFFRVIA